MSKIIFLTFFVISLAVVIAVPIASAENVNVTPVTPLFITIDPIGNHAIGDVSLLTAQRT